MKRIGKMNLAPITLFVYKRLWHTERAVEALQANQYAAASDLIIFSDGPKNGEEREEINQIRAYIKGIKGFEKIEIIERQENYGLARSIIAGVTEVVNRYGRIIVMEDDLISSPYFLKFMNEGLNFYEYREKIISIHGYVLPLKDQMPETYFLRRADCWGWGTWKRGWDLFESDGKKLLQKIQTNKLEKYFDVNGSYPYVEMLKDQIKGKNDSWAIRWLATAFIHNKLTLYPGRSLIQNIGHDNTGSHSMRLNCFDVELTREPINIQEIPEEENTYVHGAVAKFYRSIGPNWIKKPLKKIKKYFVETCLDR